MFALTTFILCSVDSRINHENNCEVSILLNQKETVPSSPTGWILVTLKFISIARLLASIRGDMLELLLLILKLIFLIFSEISLTSYKFFRLRI